ncbi:MAG TPA: hypothetical protein VIR30_17340 [Nocardioides sp.]
MLRLPVVIPSRLCETPSRRFRLARARAGRECCVQRESRADVEHPIDFAMRETERRSGVSDAVELFAVSADARVGASAQRRPASSRALGGDEPLIGVRIAAGQHGR